MLHRTYTQHAETWLLAGIATVDRIDSHDEMHARRIARVYDVSDDCDVVIVLGGHLAAHTVAIQAPDAAIEDAIEALYSASFSRRLAASGHLHKRTQMMEETGGVRTDVTLIGQALRTSGPERVACLGQLVRHLPPPAPEALAEAWQTMFQPRSMSRMVTDDGASDQRSYLADLVHRVEAQAK